MAIWIKEFEQAATVLSGSPQTIDCHNSDNVTVFHPDGRIILLCSRFALKEMDVICCDCDFVNRSIVLQLQQKSDLAKSGSGRILGVGYLSVGYLNPVGGIRQKISICPSLTRRLWYSAETWSAKDK